MQTNRSDSFCISLAHEFEFTEKYSLNRHYTDPLFLPLPHLSDVSDVVFWRILEYSTVVQGRKHEYTRWINPVHQCVAVIGIFVCKNFFKIRIDSRCAYTRVWSFIGIVGYNGVRVLWWFSPRLTRSLGIFLCVSRVMSMPMYTAALNNRQGHPRTALVWRLISPRWISEIDYGGDRAEFSALGKFYLAIGGGGGWVKRPFCACPLNRSVPDANGTTAVYAYLSVKSVQTRRLLSQIFDKQTTAA